MIETLPFLKMHGLGNDFVVLDGRGQSLEIAPSLARAIGDRHRGVGFDQLVLIEDSDTADARLEFWNTDGSRSDACGNGTRCAADLLMRGSGSTKLVLETAGGVLACRRAEGQVEVNMGQPILDWRNIPLSREMDIDALPLDGTPSALSMGNPHCVFFVEAAEAVDLATAGPQIEHHPLFPQRTNVEFVHLVAPDLLRMRVWERGSGITQACGSGACAAAVAASRRRLTGRKVELRLDGGTLYVDWREDGVWLRGPVAYVHEGQFFSQFLGDGQ